MVSKKGKVLLFKLKRDTSTQGTGNKMQCMAGAFKIGMMDKLMKDNSRQIKEMDSGGGSQAII